MIGISSIDIRKTTVSITSVYFMYLSSFCSYHTAGTFSNFQEKYYFTSSHWKVPYYHKNRLRILCFSSILRNKYNDLIPNLWYWILKEIQTIPVYKIAVNQNTIYLSCCWITPCICCWSMKVGHKNIAKDTNNTVAKVAPSLRWYIQMVRYQRTKQKQSKDQWEMRSSTA